MVGRLNPNAIVPTRPAGTKDNSAASTAFVTAVAGTIGQIPGTTTNDNANPGNVGEYREAIVSGGAPTALTRFTPTLLTTLSLTAGDWNVWGAATFMGQTNDISVGLIAASLSSGSSPPADLDASNISELTGNNSLMFQSANIPTCTPPLKRFSFAVTTNIYMMVYAGYTASATNPSSKVNCFGAIRSRRAR